MHSIPAQLAWMVVALAAAAAGAVAQISARALGQEKAQEMKERGQAGWGMRAWLGHPLRYLLSTLMARVGGVTAAAFLAARMGHALGGAWAAWGALVGVLAWHVVGVEIGLCTWAKHRARAAAGPALAAYAAVDLLLWGPSAVAANLAERLAGRLTAGDAKAMRAGPFLTEEDMERLWGLTPQAGQPEQQEHRLLQGVLDASEAVVRDVMIPRARVVFGDVEATPDDMLKSFAQHAHTRLVVCQGTLDKVLGVLFLTDLVRARAAGGPVNVRSLMRRPYFVPEFMKVMDLLREFQRRRTHLAIVVDEFGTTSGMVTLQDVVEEIVGDVRDEDEVAEVTMREVRPGVWLLDARTPVDTASEALGVELPNSGAYETVGGYIITLVGRLPPPGTVVKRAGLRWTVKDADERRVVRVEVERDASTAGNGEGEPRGDPTSVPPHAAE